MKLWGIGQISPSEKNDILSKHRELYNGYRSVYPEVSNTQPLYVQDFANDKGGITVNNKGEVKPYTNVGINESVHEGKGMCSECGGMMYEGGCSECGYKMEGEMDEKKMMKSLEEYLNSEMSEETGHLDDIYDEEDLNPNDEFDYVKGASNKTNAFHVDEEEMMDTPIGKISAIGAMKEKTELDELGIGDLEKGKKYKYKLPSFEDEVEFDDEFEDKFGGEKMYKFKGKNSMSHLMPSKGIEKFVDKIDEQGGNADDMDVDDVEPAYDFQSNGPMDGGDVYPVNEDGDFDELADLDTDVEDESDNLEQEGYEPMESAWNEEIDEVDVSGSQGVYGDMKPAFDFDSEGPGKGGPYQEYHGSTMSDEDMDSEEDEFDTTDKSWEEITAKTGGDEFGYVDEDLKESFIKQKNKINEMMNRMKIIK